MSLASDLLHSTGKKTKADISRAKTTGPVERLLALSPLVYGLLSEHEPAGNSVSMVRSDLRIMRLSGLTTPTNPGMAVGVYGQAAKVLSELAHLLPKTRQ